MNIPFYFQILSADLNQNLDEEDGIFGFAIEDVKKEIARASKLVSTIMTNNTE